MADFRSNDVTPPVLLPEFHYFSLVVLNLNSDSTVFSYEILFQFHSGEVVKMFT